MNDNTKDDVPKSLDPSLDQIRATYAYYKQEFATVRANTRVHENNQNTGQFPQN